MNVFKRINELEDENEDLKEKMMVMANFFAAISEMCNEYKKKNLSVAYVGFNRIKHFAELGQDIKNEQIENLEE